MRTIPKEWKGFRICSHCGQRIEEGFYLDGDYACSRECAVALYNGDEAQLEADIQAEMNTCGSTDCYHTAWIGTE